MTGDTLPAAALDIIREEEALLQRAVDAIRKAWEAATRTSSPGRDELRSDVPLRALRDQAITASPEDLPGLLHDLEVRQQLHRRHAQGPALPDPRTPYLAHLRIREGKGSKDYLLGHHGFVDAAAGIRIVDWRVAPVAQIFYNYREGDVFEEDFPTRVVEGQVEARRVLVISAGVLQQIVGDDVVLARRPDRSWSAVPRGALSLQPGGRAPRRGRRTWPARVSASAPAMRAG